MSNSEMLQKEKAEVSPVTTLFSEQFASILIFLSKYYYFNV